MTATTINPDELAKFSAMADEWWDPNGKFRPLHRLNPSRLSYIREHLIARFGRDAASLTPFEGLRLLDIGSGGGLLSEPLARLGAGVTGIDPSEQSVRIAAAHAERSGVAVDYRAVTAEDLAAAGEQFDAVLALEVVEHVDDVPLFIKSCAALVRPGGLLFLSTINRTPRAWALAIVAAERVLRWLPPGTHDYRKFLTPDEIAALFARNGLRELDRTGMVFHPLADEWRRSRDLGVNYMMLAEKPAA